jgi:hypothetical protein
MTQHSDQSTTQSTNASPQTKKPRRFRPRRMTVVMLVTIVLTIACMAALAFFYQAKRDTKELMRTQTVMGDVLARAANYSSGKAISQDNHALGNVLGVITNKAEREQLLAKKPFVHCSVRAVCSDWITVTEAEPQNPTIARILSVSHTTKGSSPDNIREILQDASTRCALWRNNYAEQMLCVSTKTGRYVYDVGGNARDLSEWQ